MVKIYKHPNLPDYFQDVRGVRLDSAPETIPRILPDYEAAKVFFFSALRPKIDFDFWARLPADRYPGFKKMVCYVDETTQSELVQRALRKAEAPAELLGALSENIESLFRQIMPIYYRLFDGYEYSVKRVVFRLNTTLNENLHFDTYGKEEFPEHLARMFINLDTQPRIWHTSYTVDDIVKKFGHKVSREVLEKTTANRFWRELNIAAFGKGHEWYDGEPRHVIYFEPGDVWVVDSRQVAHQIFYGRRAVSIDFVVKLDSMLDRNKHYLAMSERIRNQLLGSREAA